jgi:hypothetical protein
MLVSGEGSRRESATSDTWDGTREVTGSWVPCRSFQTRALAVVPERPLTNREPGVAMERRDALDHSGRKARPRMSHPIR